MAPRRKDENLFPVRNQEVLEECFKIVDALISRREDLGASQIRLSLHLGRTFNCIHAREKNIQTKMLIDLVQWAMALGLRIELKEISDDPDMP